MMYDVSYIIYHTSHIIHHTSYIIPRCICCFCLRFVSIRLPCLCSSILLFNTPVIAISSVFACFTSYIIHHTSYIIHHTSYIIHHTSYIIHHTSYIIHHTSYIIHYPCPVVVLVVVVFDPLHPDTTPYQLPKAIETS